MLMVVFGAGASFDSVSGRTIPPTSHAAQTLRPPLARQLFEQRESFGDFIDRNPRCRPIVVQLRGIRDGRTVEEQLAQYDSEVAAYPTRAVHLAATRFYLRDLIHSTARSWSHKANGVTNYVDLVDRIERQRSSSGASVAYVTFNYDTLLEDAITSVSGPRFERIDQYVDGRTPVFKVHGSTDWGFLIENPESALKAPDGGWYSPRSAVERIDRMQWGAIEKASFLDPYPGVLSRSHLPAVALPVLNKGAESFTLPRQHIAALRECASRTESLLVIGWAAADGHFLELLQKARCKPVRTLIVAGDASAAGQVASELTRVHNQGLITSSWGFSSLLDEGRETLDEFLRAALHAP